MSELGLADRIYVSADEEDNGERDGLCGLWYQLVPRKEQ